MTEDRGTCHHCGLPIPAGVDIRDHFRDDEVQFCCHGCHGAFLIISGSGLERFYRQRSWQEAGTPEGAFETAYDAEALAPYIVPVDDTHSEISLLVDGIRCASCVWLLEKVLKERPGVADIRVNYGSHRARIIYDHDTTGPQELLGAISRLGYLPRPFSRNALHEAAAREQKSLLIRFGTAGFLSMQLMGFSLALYAGYFQGIDLGVRQLIQYFAAAVTTPVVFYSGWPFISGALRSLINRAPNMDLLIALGVLTAYLYSLFAMFSGGEVYFDTAGMIITLILLGRLLENTARNRSLSGIDRLLQLAPDNARQTDGHNSWIVQSIALKPGDSIVVLPGERVPVDAVVTEGESEFDESTVTGEALPVFRTTGDPITSGSLNLTNSITLEVARIKAESFISRMNRLVEEAQDRKAPVQSLADHIAAVFVPAVTLIALATWLFWTWRGDNTTQAMLNAVAVLIVACPCALGLATPTAVLVATGQAAGVGILFRGGDILETASRADIIAFDKTGTLTFGRPMVTDIVPAQSTDPTRLLELAASVAGGSSHPLARAIFALAEAQNIKIAPIRSVETIPGRGLLATSERGLLRLGSRLYLEENGISLPPPHHQLTESHLAINDNYLGTFLFADPVRPEAKETIKVLQRFKMETVILTGDRAAPAREVATGIGITACHAQMTPADQAAWSSDRQTHGHTVIIVGDGINDAPALSQADLGCAMAGGTDIALETSDLVLNRQDLGRLVVAISLARQTLRAIRQNLFWAFSYNLVAIPLAASGQLAPVWAAAAMASSSILVIGNSLRLGRQLKKDVAIGT